VGLIQLAQRWRASYEHDNETSGSIRIGEFLIIMATVDFSKGLCSTELAFLCVRQMFISAPFSLFRQVFVNVTKFMDFPNLQ
jgi:hypothetical protein